MCSLEIVCYQTDDVFEQLKSAWQRLERLDTQCMPFNTWHWNRLWWQHYAGKRDLITVLTAIQGERIVAIAPLFIQQTRMLRVIPTRVLRFVGSGYDTSPDYLNIIAEPHWRDDAELALLEYVSTIPNWHKLYLSDVRADSTLAARIKFIIGLGPGTAIPATFTTIQRSGLPASFEEYRASLSRKRRKQINHRRNRLDAAGKSELALCTTLDEVMAATDALVILHRQRWQSKRLTGKFRTKAYEHFHRAVIRQFFSDNSLWLVTLKLNHRIIGVQYIFEWRGELLFVQSGYSPAAINLSPGHVLFTYVIQRAIENGLSSIDLLKGEYDYKSVYARDTTKQINQGLVRPGLRSIAQKCYNRRLQNHSD